jgi:hypothetical protein
VEGRRAVGAAPGADGGARQVELQKTLNDVEVAPARSAAELSAQDDSFVGELIVCKTRRRRLRSLDS